MHRLNSHKRFPLAALVVVAAIAVPLASPAPAAARCAGAGADPAEVSLGKIRSATTCLINQKRKRHGLRRLRGNRDLRTAATGHSRDMVRQRYFSHYSRNGDSATDRIRATGYLWGSNRWATGENIGWGAYSRAKPRRMVRAWMRSDSHRRTILRRKYRHIGVGVARGAPVKGLDRAATYTTDFGRR